MPELVESDPEERRNSLSKVKLSAYHFSFEGYLFIPGTVKMLRSQLSLMPSHRAKRQKVEFKTINVGRT